MNQLNARPEAAMSQSVLTQHSQCQIPVRVSDDANGFQDAGLDRGGEKCSYWKLSSSIQFWGKWHLLSETKLHWPEELRIFGTSKRNKRRPVSKPNEVSRLTPRLGVNELVDARIRCGKLLCLTMSRALKVCLRLVSE